MQQDKASKPKAPECKLIKAWDTAGGLVKQSNMTDCYYK